MRLAGWLVPVASAACVAALLVALPPGWIVGAEGALAGWRDWLGAVRATAIAAAWVWWDALVERMPSIGANGAAHLKRRRTFWIGALAAVELVVVRNLPGILWSLAA